MVLPGGTCAPRARRPRAPALALAAAIVSLGVACGGDDASDSSASATGTETASSTTTTTTGAGGGATCDGLCAPSPPDGWTGPALLYVGDSPPASCAAWATRTAAHAGEVAAASTCTPCACDAPAGATCSAVLVIAHDQKDCTGLAGTLNPPTNQCAALPPTTKSTNLLDASMPLSAGTCAPTGGELVAAPPLWEHEAIVCGDPAPATGSCDGDASCVAAAPPGVGAAPCVTHDGDIDCPAAFPAKAVVFLDAEDTSTCGACSCDAPVGTSCDSVAHAYSDAACTLDETVVSDVACAAAPTTWAGVRFSPAAAGGSCAAQSAPDAHSAAPTGSTTVCCALP